MIIIYIFFTEKTCLVVNDIPFESKKEKKEKQKIAFFSFDFNFYHKYITQQKKFNL